MLRTRPDLRPPAVQDVRWHPTATLRSTVRASPRLRIVSKRAMCSLSVKAPERVRFLQILPTKRREMQDVQYLHGSLLITAFSRLRSWVSRHTILSRPVLITLRYLNFTVDKV